VRVWEQGERHVNQSIDVRNLSRLVKGGLAGLAVCAALAATVAAGAAEVESIDWSAVPVKKPRLFAPGQSSWEWLRTEDHKKASKEVRDGEACLNCHKGEQKSLGEILTGEHRLEPDPVEGKSGYKRLSVQAAHDDTYLYLRASWETDDDKPNDVGNLLRFDGEEWYWWGNHRQYLEVIDGEEPAIYPDRLGIMIGDASVPLFAEHGCWLTCHDSLVSMADPPDPDEVSEHPVIGQLYKAFGIKNTMVRKYLPGSRTDPEDWAAVIDEAELKAVAAKGGFLDLIIWDASLTNPVGVAADFNVLEIKKVDEGTSALLPNGKMRGGPDYMFDASKTGFAALTEEDLDDPDKPKHLIVGQNTAPFDASAIEEGGLLPAHVLDPARAEGSAADVDYARGEWQDGSYTVVIRRKLDTGQPDDKALKPGGIYQFGFSVHDFAAGKRAHHVSFPVSVSIGEGKADIQTMKLP
jgi:hypothetical protein